MARNRGRTIRLTERDEAILEHIRRYRITTIEVLHRLFWKPETTLNAVSQVLARLGAHVRGVDLGARSFYQLTVEAARELGEDEDFAKPPGATSLARHFAMLEFCSLGDERREHITARELRENFPTFNGRGIARNGYFHTFDSPAKLGWLEVDCGNHAATRAKKCWRQFTKRYEAEELGFKRLADAGQFAIALVTTSPGKKLALERALQKLDPFPITIHVSSTLRELLGREAGEGGSHNGPEVEADANAGGFDS